MAAYNFKKQFVEPIRTRTKRHTIRAERADGRVPKPGERLMLYCGMRTKNCFKILEEPVECTCVRPIKIDIDSDGVLITGEAVWIDGALLSGDEKHSLALADGFDGWPQMRAFWLKNHGKKKLRIMVRTAPAEVRFKGHIIHWR